MRQFWYSGEYSGYIVAVVGIKIFFIIKVNYLLFHLLRNRMYWFVAAILVSKFGKLLPVCKYSSIEVPVVLKYRVPL